jgi:hypothetical protein
VNRLLTVRFPAFGSAVYFSDGSATKRGSKVSLSKELAMNLPSTFRAGLALTGLCLLTIGGQAQQADLPQNGAAQTNPETVHETNRQYARSILELSHQAGKKDKTFRTDYTLDVDAGNMGAISLAIRRFQANDKYRLEVVPLGRGVGEVGKKAEQLRLLEVSDGKTEFSANSNTYTRKPIDKNKASIDDGPFSFFGEASAVDCELLPPVTLNGHPVFVIRMQSDDKDAPGQMMVFIDQDTYRTRKFDLLLKGTPGGPLHFTVTLNHNVINPTMSPDLFRFTPPKGAKETKATSEAGVTILQTAMAGLVVQNAAKTK